ncbi:MAG: hypothetical protein FHK80_00805 [Azoarcus sp. PHD]|nr:MAG: hypothetical protein FHK80_00805 [Azoarcus sp. PHD]
MTATRTVRAYRKAIEALQAAERTHNRNTDELDAAFTAKDAKSVYSLREVVRKSETALIEALDTACRAHGAYWRERLEIIRPEAIRAAAVLRAYDAIARCTGNTQPEPHRIVMLDVALVKPDALINDDAVPTEQPDSAVLDDLLGCWRR